MDSLPPDERRLLAEYVAARTPDEGAIARALAATLHRVEHGPAVPEPVVAEVRPQVVWARVVMFAIAAAAVVLIAWRGFAVLERSGGEIGRESAVDVVSPAAQERGEQSSSLGGRAREDRPSVDPPEIGASAPAPALDVTPPVVGESAPVGSELGSRRSKGSGGSRGGLAQELSLLREADAALDRGDARRALALLDEHARTFPRGQMVPERMLQKAIALCRLGKGDKARAAIAKLLRAHPSTPLRARATEVCREDAP